jgi:CcmD family protein
MIIIPCFVQAQSAGLDFLRSTGKIYVVIAILVAIFIGIVLFLIRLDKKLTKIENQINT